ncbi:MAG: FAD-binding domain-containing protein [Ilumatobacteraceae bacterium]
MVRLPTPEPGRTPAVAFVADHLAHLVDDGIIGSGRFPGGQRAATDALTAYDVAGYAGRRNQVLPVEHRGASGLSPYIRHGLLSLTQVFRHVEGGPARDVRKFRDELLWQEFSRHWYARLGQATRQGVRRSLPPVADRDAATIRVDGSEAGHAPGWDHRMACVDRNVGELVDDGWLVNQTRMWLSSQWAVRQGLRWQDGEDQFFRHLLDGSRAANRLGWQWTTGTGSSKHYSFSRYQVRKRAPGLCDTCALNECCPIAGWPAAPPLRPTDRPSALRDDPHPLRTAGPADVVRTRTPEAVWLTAESLGDADPALAANPGLPVVFVFDERLLRGLRLSAKRLIFLTETLAELGVARELHLHLGDPVEVLAPRAVAVTFAPVPGFRRRAEAVVPAETHPWPWLTRPAGGSVSSFSTWRRTIRLPATDEPDQSSSSTLR